MRQFMQACPFAFTDAVSVIRPDLDPTLKMVSVASALAAHHRQGVGVGRESCLEPFHLLDGADVSRAMLVVYDTIAHDQHRFGQIADWQARGQLGVIRRFL